MEYIDIYSGMKNIHSEYRHNSPPTMNIYYLPIALPQNGVESSQEGMLCLGLPRNCGGSSYFVLVSVICRDRI